MIQEKPHKSRPLALVTGAAKRLGRCICEHLHQAGYDLVLHYQTSSAEALALCDRLNEARAHSAVSYSASLENISDLKDLVRFVITQDQALHLLVNNASVFYPTPLPSLSLEDWERTINVNLRAPLLLSQNLHELLRTSGGSIVNLVDIYSERPLADHTAYNVSKAGMEMLTKSLAKDLAPDVRVNGVSPGAILWPEQNESKKHQNDILKRIPLQRSGNPDDIAASVVFLAQSPYITGQILKVDGGRSLNM